MLHLADVDVRNLSLQQLLALSVHSCLLVLQTCKPSPGTGPYARTGRTSSWFVGLCVAKHVVRARTAGSDLLHFGMTFGLRPIPSKMISLLCLDPLTNLEGADRYHACAYLLHGFSMVMGMPADYSIGSAW